MLKSINFRRSCFVVLRTNYLVFNAKITLLGLCHADERIDNYNDFLVSVSSNLPRLTNDLAVFDVQDEIPAEYVISVMTTENALQHIKLNKAVGPDIVPAWVLRDNASTLAAPLTALVNTSLRDGVIPALWKTAHVIPLPKKHHLHGRSKKIFVQFHLPQLFQRFLNPS